MTDDARAVFVIISSFFIILFRTGDDERTLTNEVGRLNVHHSFNPFRASQPVGHFWVKTRQKWPPRRNELFGSARPSCIIMLWLKDSSIYNQQQQQQLSNVAIVRLIFIAVVAVVIDIT